VRRREFRSVDGAQLAAKKRLPKSVYEYVEGGTEGRLTVAANRNSFNEIEFLPRAGIVSDKVDLRTTILGCELSMPVIVAPAGFIRLAHRHGEVGAAKAAGAAGPPSGSAHFRAIQSRRFDRRPRGRSFTSSTSPAVEPVPSWRLNEPRMLAAMH
jgi:hypothetical protein